MSRRTRQNIILMLVSFLCSLVLTEIALRVTDPLGVYRGYSQAGQLNIMSTPGPGASLTYTFRAGTLDMQTWTAHINADGNRVVLHTDAASSCHVATIGDSVTFGQSVNDDQVWPDLIAQAIGGIDIINPSKPGYNARNFGPLVDATPATAYIYLAVGNDANPPAIVHTVHPARNNDIALEDYIYYALLDREVAFRSPDVSHYVADMGDVLTMPNLIIFSDETNAFNTELLKARPDTIILPHWTHNVSRADGHPTAAGQQQIAQAMLPALKMWLQRVCSD